MGNEGLGEHGLEGVPYVHTAKVDRETSILGQTSPAKSIWSLSEGASALGRRGAAASNSLTLLHLLCTN